MDFGEDETMRKTAEEKIWKRGKGWSLKENNSTLDIKLSQAVLILIHLIKPLELVVSLMWKFREKEVQNVLKRVNMRDFETKKQKKSKIFKL